MTRTLPLLCFALLPLGALLPAQTPQNLGVFPEALYAIQPALDQVLHLNDEQLAKIATRAAPLREELRLLEEEFGTAEPAQRGKLLVKLQATRTDIEPALRRVAESALDSNQKAVVALTHDLHADAVRGAAEELTRLAKKGQTTPVPALVQQQVAKLCPGLGSTDLGQVESALAASLAKSAGSSAGSSAVGKEAAPKKRSKGADLLEALAAGALQGIAASESGKPKDLLRDLAEGAANAALEQATSALLDKVQKSKARKKE